MGTPVTFNGTSYTVPALGDSGWAQGAGNLSSYLIAIASGTLQTTGGSFTLSAPVDFGATYGLLTAYVTSKSASPATAGVLRLAIGDTIDWGLGNLALSVSGTDLLWNGSILQTASIAFPVAIADGGTGQITAAAAITALTGSQTSGHYLRSDGTNAALSAIQAGDVPTLNQNTTGNADTATLAATATTAVTATTATNIAGGIASEIPYQTGSGATAFISNGSAGQLLTSNGTSAPSWTSASGSYPPVSTRQVLTSGTSATYTTPSGPAPRQLQIRMVGGGGGGGASSVGTGGVGGTTIFNSINANGGSGGLAGSNAAVGTAGGTGGSGSASLRLQGGFGNSALGSGGSGRGGDSVFIGGGVSINGSVAAAGNAGITNTGGGGGGGCNGASTEGAGGGAGEYVELIINSPTTSYTYTVGGAGTAGSGTGLAGGAGGSGIIIVDELY